MSPSGLNVVFDDERLTIPVDANRSACSVRSKYLGTIEQRLRRAPQQIRQILGHGIRDVRHPAKGTKRPHDRPRQVRYSDRLVWCLQRWCHCFHVLLTSQKAARRFRAIRPVSAEPARPSFFSTNALSPRCCGTRSVPTTFLAATACTEYDGATS